MTDGLPNLPDWIEEKITFDDENDYQTHYFVKPFIETDRPWLSASYVANEVGTTPTTTRNRFSDLEELGILDSAPGANGNVYWIRNDVSDWPIPPDVDVEPVEEPNGVTVSELTSRRYVQVGLTSVAAALSASLLISVPIGSAVGGIELIPQDIMDLILALGLTAALFAVALGVVTVLVWWYSKPISSE